MIKFYLTNFIFSGSLMFVFFWLIRLANMGPGKAAQGAFFFALSFACMMAFVGGTIHVLLVRRLAGDPEEGDIYTVFQRRTLRTRLDYDRAFALLQHYLAGTAGLKTVEADPVAGRLTANSPFSIITFGYKMRIEVKRDPAGGSLVSINSSPRLITVMMDFGENLKAVRKAAEFLAASAQQN